MDRLIIQLQLSCPLPHTHVIMDLYWRETVSRLVKGMEPGLDLPDLHADAVSLYYTQALNQHSYHYNEGYASIEHAWISVTCFWNFMW